MGKALLENQTRDFWSETKRAYSRSTLVNVIDGIEGEREICNFVLFHLQEIVK